MSNYTEPAALRDRDPAPRVYAYILFILDQYEGCDPGSQHAAQEALETADRNLVEREPERFVDPLTGDLALEDIRRYVLKSAGWKAKATWVYDGATLDGPVGDDDRTFAEVVPATAETTLRVGSVYEDPVFDEVAWREEQAHELDPFALAEARNRRAARDAARPGRLVRAWLAEHPGVVSAEAGEVLALRAEGLGFKAIGKRLAPAGDAAAVRRASARARQHVKRARPKLPPEIAALLPEPNRQGQDD